jgi:hypothetical protein
MAIGVSLSRIIPVYKTEERSDGLDFVNRNEVKSNAVNRLQGARQSQSYFSVKPESLDFLNRTGTKWSLPKVTEAKRSSMKSIVI